MKRDATAELQAIQAMPPVKFGGIHLTADGVSFHGKPDFGDFVSALSCAKYMGEKAPFWEADLLTYAATRPDWEGILDSVVDAGKFTKRTIDQYRYVSKNVPQEDRVDGLSFSHHEAVAALPSGDKRIFLAKAKREHLSVAELKHAVRKVKSRKIIKGQAGELAALSEKVRNLAWDAVDACKAIARDDAKHGLAKIAEARRILDHTEKAVRAFHKAQGKKTP